jgi:hypothetical protein
LNLYFNINPFPSLVLIWSFLGEPGSEELLFNFPRDADILTSLITVSRTLYRQVYPLVMREISISYIRQRIVVNKDDWLALFFPNIPWALFSAVWPTSEAAKFNLTPPWSLMTCEMGEQQTATYGLGPRPHICQFTIPEWIRVNEKTCYNELKKRERANNRKKLHSRNPDNRWIARCRGWMIPYPNQSEEVKANYRHILGDKCCLTITKGTKTTYEENRLHSGPKVISRDWVPKHIQQRRDHEMNRRSSGFIPFLGSSITIFHKRWTMENTVEYFNVKKSVRICSNVNPEELVTLVGLLKKSVVKQLFYRRISEVPRVALVALRDILLPKLVCLKGDWNPNLVAEEVFGEVWHPWFRFSTSAHKQIAKELKEVRDLVRGYVMKDLAGDDLVEEEKSLQLYDVTSYQILSMCNLVRRNARRGQQ